jgi:hypothetical protein
LDGWVEIEHESDTNSFMRVLDEGGMVWEGKRTYPRLEDGLQDLDQGVGKLFEDKD